MVENLGNLMEDFEMFRANKDLDKMSNFIDEIKDISNDLSFVEFYNYCIDEYDILYKRLEYKKHYQKEYRKNNKERIKRLRVKHQHGITLEEYNNAMSSQHCCEICGTENNLCYDHDHTDDSFRGVLCKTCNTGIGLLGDNLAGLNRAVMYLRGKNK